MKKLLLSATLISSLFLYGCSTTKKNLDPAGAYHQDTFLYSSDKAIVDSYLVVDTFLKWEEQNNAYVKTNIPVAFSIANQIRDNAPVALKEVKQARNAYIAFSTNPVGDFASISNKLQSQVSELVLESQSFSAIALNSSLSNSFISTLSTVTNNSKLNIDSLLYVSPIN